MKITGLPSSTEKFAREVLGVKKAPPAPAPKKRKRKKRRARKTRRRS
jgi:hypothetical protein